MAHISLGGSPNYLRPTDCTARAGAERIGLDGRRFFLTAPPGCEESERLSPSGGSNGDDPDWAWQGSDRGQPIKAIRGIS